MEEVKLNISSDNPKYSHTTNSIMLNTSHKTDDEKKGLMNIRALTFLALWYLFSFCTLFLNKYILTTLGGDATLLGNTQMVMTTSLGCLQMYLPFGFKPPVDRKGKPPNFWRNMIIVGSTRFSSVVLGLLALKYVAVSFVETIKSSAPIFTVAISYFLLREQTGVFTMISLVPVMVGLAMCSAYELSFNLPGFAAALATNITDCMQNVYSKMLISGEKHRYTPIELQFYTSLSSFFVQIPASVFMINFQAVRSSSNLSMLTALILNGVFFHCQSISAYVLMGFISPVTHSVANTVKRALLIWLSVIIFSNSVTFLSGLGTCMVIIGVLCYTKARQHDATRLGLKLAQKYDVELNCAGNQSGNEKLHMALPVRSNSTSSDRDYNQNSGSENS